MKKGNFKKLSRRNRIIIGLLCLGYVLFIGVLYFLCSKEELAKASWGFTTFVYWLFVSLMWFGIKMEPVFNGAVKVLVEETAKQLKE
ncbi:MAG: hypothetical protein NT068_04190 [Candidatus Nomurabacteria bacterium]|nr:hypothetical protein [Candidatus Nomurabacteria bacterium]